MYNNPRADNQYDGMDDNTEASIKDKMLFDDESPRGKDTAKENGGPFIENESVIREDSEARGDSSHWSGLEHNDNLAVLYNYIYERETMTAKDQNI